MSDWYVDIKKYYGSDFFHWEWELYENGQRVDSFGTGNWTVTKWGAKKEARELRRRIEQKRRDKEKKVQTRFRIPL